MLTFRVMDRTGDTATTFDVDHEAEVDKAMARFKELCEARKHLAHIPSGTGEPGELVRASDPDLRDKLLAAEEVIFQPQLIGG